MEKVNYTCKNCGWKTSILLQWSDLKPKRCMNRKCNTSFLKTPDNLLIQLPQQEEPISIKVEDSKTKKKTPKLNVE